VKIRRDSVFIASVLFTIALLSLVPWCWQDTLEGGGLLRVMSGRHAVYPEGLDTGERIAAQAIGDRGIASLTLICIGLIVTWMGYAKRLRWTWFVLLVIMWGWGTGTPVPLPIHKAADLQPVGEVAHRFVPRSHSPSGSAVAVPRTLLEMMLVFVLMLIALILPIKTFLQGGKGPAPAKGT
jgi:hypothetical protein